MTDKAWRFENSCQVCRTTLFPEYSQYVGFGDITGEEREAFTAWKNLFEQGKAKIELLSAPGSSRELAYRQYPNLKKAH